MPHNHRRKELKAGDEVVTVGQQKIFDGAKVATAVPAKAAPAKPEGQHADAPAAKAAPK